MLHWCVTTRPALPPPPKSKQQTTNNHQIHERNDGRDPFPVFLRRGPLPRGLQDATLAARVPKSACYR